MITFRDLIEDDLDDVLRWRNDPQINRYLAAQSRTRADLEAGVARIKSNPLNRLLGILVDGQLIGYGIVEDVDSRNRKCEIGVVIGDFRLWGKGIGATAVRELLRYCFSELELHRVLAVIAKGNELSEGLFRKMGFTLEGTLRHATLIDGQFTDLLCYSMLEHEYRDDWHPGGEQGRIV